MEDYSLKRLVTNSIKFLIIYFIIFSAFFSKNAFAKPASEQKSPVDTSLTKHLEYPSILDLLPNNLRDGNEIYIPREYLRKEASILCSYKGTSLPGRKDTAVKSGGKSARYRIDDPIKGANKGKETGFLTLEDKGATVYNDGTDYINQKNPFSETHSKTYGKFSIVDTYSATPAESWVLTELNMNNPEKNIKNYEKTNEIYKTMEQLREEKLETEDIEVPEHQYQSTDGMVVWAVEWENNDEEDGKPTKFVTKVNDTYYIVKIKDKDEDYASYPLYVQHAWWKVKEVGEDAAGTSWKAIQDTDLAYEAEEFEKYISRIAVLSQNKVQRKIRGKNCWQF